MRVGFLLFGLGIFCLREDGDLPARAGTSLASQTATEANTGQDAHQISQWPLGGAHGGQTAEGTGVFGFAPLIRNGEWQLEVFLLQAAKQGQCQFLFQMWNRLAECVGQTRVAMDLYWRSSAEVPAQTEVAEEPTERAGKKQPLFRADADWEGERQGQAAEYRCGTHSAGPGLQPAATGAQGARAAHAQADLRAERAAHRGAEGFGDPFGFLDSCRDGALAGDGDLNPAVQVREPYTAWETAAPSCGAANASSPRALESLQRKGRLRSQLERLHWSFGPAAAEADERAADHHGGLCSGGGGMATPVAGCDFAACPVDGSIHQCVGAHRRGQGRGDGGCCYRRRGGTAAKSGSSRAAIPDAAADPAGSAATACGKAWTRRLADSAPDCHSHPGRSGRGQCKSQTAIACWIAWCCCQGGAQAAPQIGPCDSSRSAQGPDLRLGSWSHSIVFDATFVGPYMAQLLALQQEFAVKTDDHQIFQWLQDIRADQAAPDGNPCFWSTPAAAHWKAQCCFGSRSDELSGCFQAPSLRMGGQEVEPDVQPLTNRGDELQNTQLSQALHGDAQSTYVQSRLCPGPVHSALASCLHVYQHGIPLRVHFERGPASCDRWRRELNNCSRRCPSPAGCLLQVPVPQAPYLTAADSPSRSQRVPPNTGASTAPVLSRPEVFQGACADGSLLQGDCIVGPTDISQSQRVQPVARTVAAPLRCPAYTRTFPPLRLQLAAAIPIYPAELDRPELRSRPVTSFAWVTGYRVAGAVSGHAGQYDRFAIYDSAHHAQVRQLPRAWDLDHIVAEILSIFPRVRSVRFLRDRLPNMPSVQVSVVMRDAPAGQTVIPLDFRAMEGGICTVRVMPNTAVEDLRQICIRDCPHARLPRVRFALADGFGQFLHIPADLEEMPDYGRGVPPEAIAQVTDVGEAATGDDFDGQPDLLPEADHADVASLVQLFAKPRDPSFPARPSHSPVLPSKPCFGTQVTFAQVPALCPITVPAGDPPTLLRTEGPPRASVVHSATKVPTILPERLAAPNLREIPAGQLCLFCQAVAHHNELRKYSVFDRHRHHSVRKASYQWSLLDYVVDATGSAVEETQSVQVLTLPIADLPEPQLSITPIGLPPGVLVLPLDARPIGGPICALPLQPGMDFHQVFEALVRIAPSLASRIDFVLQQDGAFLQDPTGRIWEMLPPDLSEVQWLKVIIEPWVQLQLSWFATPGAATTFTSTAVGTAQQASSPTETISFILAGGGTIVRLAPQPIRQANVRQSLCELLFILGLQGRVPQRPVVSLAAAAPRQAAQPANRIVIFLVYPASDIGEVCHILQDYSLDGSLLQEMSVDCDVVAGHLISEAHRRRGYIASLNGIPHTASGRPLITGDLIPPSARVTPIDALFDVLPDLRFFSMPLRVPSLIQLMRDPAAGLGRQEVIKEAMQRSLDHRILERRVEVGEPGHNCQAILVLGPEHPPLLLYMPSNVAPSLAEATTYLAWSGFFEPGTAFVDPQVFAHTFPVFVSVPKGSQRATILFPAPHTLLHWLQLNVPIGTPLQGFGLPVRRNFELVLPARTTHGAVIRERIIGGRASSPDPGGVSLLQVRAKLVQPRLTTADDEAQVPSARRAPTASIPTPFGRCRVPTVPGAAGCNSLCQGPASTVEPFAASRPHESAPRRAIVLADLVEKPQAVVTWGVNDDIREACFADHTLPDFVDLRSVPRNSACPAVRQWLSLPDWMPSQPCDELFVFTDGSFFPGSSSASWALVIIARQGSHIGKVGVRAGSARGPEIGSSAARPVLSAFDGELEAALHALAVAAATPCPLVQVGVDCAAAIDVVQGHVALHPQDAVAHAAVATRALLMMQGKTVLIHKVLAHAGCALHGLADAAAKNVLKSGRASADEFSAFWAAVSEGVVAKLWLVPPHPLTASTLPYLNDSGSWIQAGCAAKSQEKLPSIFGTQPQNTPCQQVDLRLRILQYNALSLRGAGAIDLIAKGLTKHRVDVAGLQETRLATDGIVTLEGFWVLHSPCTPQGSGGIQIWVRRSKHWDRQAFAVLHKEPQLLVALGVFKGIRVLLVSAHALPACSPDADLQEWWGHFDTILHRSPASCVPLFMLDANATFAGGSETADTHKCRPKCGNSSRLLEMAHRRGLCLSPQQSAEGTQLFPGPALKVTASSSTT